MKTLTVTSVKLSQLSDLPKCATVFSKLDVARYEKIARSCPKELFPIRVGRVGNKMYPISQLYVVTACKNVGLHEIKAYVEDYDSKHDLLVAHVRLHSSEEPLNPLAIRSMVDEMGIKNMDSTTALKALFLQDTAYAKIMTSQITEQAINELQKLVDELSSRLSTRNLVCPIYIILQIGKLQPDLQLQAVSEIRCITLLESDYRFIWPTPDQIEMILSNMTPSKNQKPAELAAISDEIADTGEHVSKKNISENRGSSKKTTKTKPKANADTKTLLRQSKDVVIITDEKDGKPNYIVNVKSHTVQKVKKTDDNKSFILYGDLGKNIYTLPNDVAAYHSVERCILHHKSSSKTDTIASQLKKLDGKSGLKLTLFWSTE